MTLSVAIQMDPVETIDIDGDSSFALGLEALNRGYDLFHYHVHSLTYRSGDVVARARPLQLRRERGNHFSMGAPQELDLRRTDVVLMRQDPPFHMGYITATHILELIHPKTLVINDPAHVRNAPEKLFIAQFPDLMPATTITRDRGEISRFREVHVDIIVKPLFGNGGAGVFHVTPEDENLNALLELFESQFPEPLIVQEYLPAVRYGDKRIILIDGEPAGAIARVPAVGEARANMHVGAKAIRSTLDARDREICGAIGPALRARGLLFVGIDVIGGRLTEINVTSPTGLQEINRFDNTCLEARIWDAIEAKLKKR